VITKHGGSSDRTLSIGCERTKVLKIGHPPRKMERREQRNRKHRYNAKNEFPHNLGRGKEREKEDGGGNRSLGKLRRTRASGRL
jgi:hypothetical protein